VQQARDSCKTSFDKVKNDLKDIRAKVGDLQLVTLTQQQTKLIS